MFENEYEFDYDRVVEDSDALYEDDFFDVIFDDDDDYDFPVQQDYEYYYHNVVDELDNE
jgi:hypothetical protein